LQRAIARGREGLSQAETIKPLKRFTFQRSAFISRGIIRAMRLTSLS
jgi:hypothetical protein